MPIMATIQITVDEKAQVSVTGPMDNRLLFYGLLEVAKDICTEHHRKSERRVIPATAEALSILDGKKN